MIIQTIQGDLLKLFKTGIEVKNATPIGIDAIAHGANCFHTMGAGIAKQITEQFPEAFQADVAHHSRGDILVPGQYSYAHTEFGTIFNIYSQFAPGKQNPDHLLNNIGMAFSSLNRDLLPRVKVGTGLRKPHIAIPLIGAGIAGGNWKDIAKRINDVTPDLDITVVEYKP